MGLLGDGGAATVVTSQRPGEGGGAVADRNKGSTSGGEEGGVDGTDADIVKMGEDDAASKYDDMKRWYFGREIERG